MWNFLRSGPQGEAAVFEIKSIWLLEPEVCHHEKASEEER
jgi:hypothetical protein